MASQERRYVSPTKPGTSADPAWLRRQQRFFTALVAADMGKGGRKGKGKGKGGGKGSGKGGDKP